MKLALLATCLSPLLLVPSAELTPTFSRGQVRTTTFSLENTSETTSVEMIMNGQSNDDELSQKQTIIRSATFTDHIQRVEAGMPTSYTREYSDLVSETSWLIDDPQGEHELNGSGDSELEGLEIVFEKVDGVFKPSFPEGEANDGNLLENLSPLLAWENFLAVGEVEVGAKWEIHPKSLWDALHLGGALPFDGVGDEDSVKVLRLAQAIFLGEGAEIDGDITATLTEINDDLATIEMEVEYSEILDLVEVIRALAPKEDTARPEPQSMSHTTDFEGTGTLIWNIKQGHAVSLQLQLSYENEQNLVMSGDMGGRTFSMEQNISSEGEFEVAIRVQVTEE